MVCSQTFGALKDVHIIFIHRSALDLTALLLARAVIMTAFHRGRNRGVK